MFNTENQTSGSPEAAKSENWRLEEGVAYFEQMLEVMSEDRTTLEFLDAAYQQLGRKEKDKDVLTRLVRLLIKERDVEALKALLPRMEASDHPPLKALLLKTNALIAPPPDLTPERPKKLSEGEIIAAAVNDAVEAETALAESWRAAGIIDDEALDRVQESLSFVPANGRPFLISALQILEKENVTLCEQCMENLADVSGAPPVPLGAYDIGEKQLSRCPQWLVRQRGVIPFAEIGGTALVAVLNPLDAKLKGEIEAGGPCRLFTATPSAVEAILEKVYGSVE
ncbi:MAG: hypothetical protein J6U17_05105 [Kiritimatiellae bacterium]|nr:hypothetical protein [Kiritimatiellia bacterium]